MRRLLVFALLVGASACDFGGPDFTGFRGLSDDPSLLVGTWEWTRSYSCGDETAACAETTPASVGYAGMLVVADDGTLVGYFDRGTFPSPVGYRVVPARANEFSDRALIRIDAPSIKGDVDYGFGVSRTRLVLGYTFIDGVRYETTYRRVR